MTDLYTEEALAATRRYFRQPEPRFWNWSHDAVSWCDGGTIVFHAELTEILRRLAVGGLPRFSPLLLLLAACRDNYRRERVEQALAHEWAILAGGAGGTGREAEELLTALGRVAALPPELRSTIDAKVALVETVFPDGRLLSPEQALGVLELLKTVPPDELLGGDARASSPMRLADTQIWTKSELLGPDLTADLWPHFTSGFVAMREGLLRVDPDALRLRLRTGLDQWIVPADIELPTDDSLRTFVSRLRHDPELSGLGRLAHDLMAAVQVPRGISEPEDLRLGGVSDIANRGPLDRLLVSELAHDDLTLAVRVAVGEALYLRREAPPRTPVRERRLLIDCGIRLWGVPRVFATAVGLALAATADRHSPVSAWRATADNIEVVDLGTREGLIAQLEKLEATPQPAAALARFFDAVGATQTAGDVILITHEDVLADRDFRNALVDLGDRPFYVAALDHSGRFRLLALSGRGTNVIREAQFDLDRLLSPARAGTRPLIRHDEGSDLPVILSVEPFPLLLPHQVNLERMAFHPNFGAVTITHDGRLMHWRQAGQGAAQISASLPAGPVRHLSIDDDGIVRLVVAAAKASPVHLLRADLTTGTHRLTVVEPEVEDPQSVVFYQRSLYLISKRHLRRVSDLGQASPPLRFNQQHRGGRFFTSGVWYTVSFDGQMPTLTRVPVHRSIALGSIAAMFDLQGRDGPWVVTRQGRVASTIDGATLWSDVEEGPIEVARISANGHVVIVRLSDKRRWGRFSLAPGLAPRFHVCPEGATVAYLGDPELRGLLRPGSLQRRFQRIGIDGAGRLTLVGRRRRAIALGMPGPKQRAVTVDAAAGELRRSRPFDSTASPRDVGYLLRVARWSDGSRAWLDSRGLLHLKSSDRSLPELTIVLVNSGAIAAWASDGRLWGPTFYTGLEGDAARPDDELLAEIDVFLARLV